MLVRLTEIGPRWRHSQDVRLGCHNGVDLISLADNEKRIWIFLQAVDQALDRCEETMRCTGRPILCWLVYYAGVLGLSDDGRTFRRAKDFTPKLSGLIYIQRLLFLEVALPHNAYESITISQRPQSAHLQRLDEVRMRYMVRGCLNPLGEFQSLRDYGQVIARSDPPAFMFCWSEDYQTLHYRDDSLSMEQLRSFASKIVSSSTMLCARLMYDWQPEFDLHSIKDDFCNLQEGFPFIDHPGIELSGAYLKLFTRACADSSNGLLVDDMWNTTAVWRYLRLKEDLLELLLAMVHVLGGQASRGTEILSLECRNGPSTERGIYVHGGSMIYVTRHHKARKITDREFPRRSLSSSASGKNPVSLSRLHPTVRRDGPRSSGLLVQGSI
jgi:hypothetical protein